MNGRKSKRSKGGRYRGEGSSIKLIRKNVVREEKRRKIKK